MRVAILRTSNAWKGDAGVGNGTIRKSVGEFLGHTECSSINTRLPEILDWSFGWGCEEEAVGVGDGTVRKSKSVGEFL